MATPKKKSKNQVDFLRLCDEIKKAEPDVEILYRAGQRVRDDHLGRSLIFLQERPFIMRRFVLSFPTLENPECVKALLELLYLIWMKCQNIPNHVDATSLFELNGPNGFRSILMKWLKQSPHRYIRPVRAKALKCLAETLEHESIFKWKNFGSPMPVIRELFGGEHCGTNLYQQNVDTKWSNFDTPIELMRIESATLVNLFARATPELRERFVGEFAEQVMPLLEIALSQGCPEIARNCCLMWHNLYCGNSERTSHLNRPNEMLNLTKSVLTKFTGKEPAHVRARTAALLRISDVSKVSRILDLALVRDSLKVVYEILAQSYVESDPVVVLACCKSIARLCQHVECKDILIGLLEGTCKSKGHLLLMMVLIKWKEYNDIIRYLMQICENISLHESLLFRNHILDSFKPALEDIISSFCVGMKDHKVGYAARRLLIAIDLR